MDVEIGAERWCMRCSFPCVFGKSIFLHRLPKKGRASMPSVLLYEKHHLFYASRRMYLHIRYIFGTMFVSRSVAFSNSIASNLLTVMICMPMRFVSISLAAYYCWHSKAANTAGTVDFRHHTLPKYCWSSAS